MSIKFIVDSAMAIPEDAPADFIDKANLIIMPIYVFVDEVEHKDGVDINADEVYSAMKNKSKVSTAQIPVGDYYKVFSELDEEHEYICAVFSSGLSGTYQSAVMAQQKIQEERPNLKIDVLDTKGVLVGISQMIGEAQRAINLGATKDEALEICHRYIENYHYVFSLDDLSDLIRGGRLSKEKGFIANVLNIKPILAVENGVINLKDKARGNAKKIDKLIEIFKADVKDLHNTIVNLGYGDDMTEMEKFEAKLREIGVQTIYHFQVGATLGVHVGHSILAMCYLKD